MDIQIKNSKNECIFLVLATAFKADIMKQNLASIKSKSIFS